MGYRKHFCCVGANSIRSGERMCISHQRQYSAPPLPKPKPAPPRSGPPLIISPPDLEQRKRHE
jgi:hypothetical protein